MHKSLEIALQVLTVEAEAILSLRDRINADFQKAVDLVLACKGKVVWTGIGKSGYVARKVASTMSSTGTPSVYLHPAESLHGDLGLLQKNDLLVAVSYAGLSAEFSPILSTVARLGIPMIAITGNRQSLIGQAATVVLDTKIDKEACPLGLAPTASSTATLAMGDALAMAALEAKGFGIEDFAQNHPGGGLGRQLLRVKDVMHSGAALPLIALNTPMKEVFSLMSRGEVRGAAGVLDATGNLAGIVTDGDIRRLLDQSKDPFQGTAGEMMTRNPRTVDSSEIAEKALFLMEQFRINVLFVTDKSSDQPRKPVGLVHIQDLLKSKVR